MFSPPLAGRSTRLEAALALADALTPVFPCVPGDKIPLTSHGFYDATTDQDQISRWWKRWPDANIAMPTGHAPDAITYDVLDVDVRPTGSGFPALRLLADLGVLRGAVAVRATPSAAGTSSSTPRTSDPRGSRSPSSTSKRLGATCWCHRRRHQTGSTVCWRQPRPGPRWTSPRYDGYCGHRRGRLHPLRTRSRQPVLPARLQPLRTRQPDRHLQQALRPLGRSLRRRRRRRRHDRPARPPRRGRRPQRRLLPAQRPRPGPRPGVDHRGNLNTRGPIFNRREGVNFRPARRGQFSTGVDFPDTSGKTLAKWRRARCVELALAGHSSAEIALEVGYQNRGTAWRAVQDSLNSRIAEAVEEYRELELARLDALQAAHWPQAVAGSVRSADLVLRVIDRRIKLLGLDQPRIEDDRPWTLIVSAPDWDEAGYISQLRAISDGSIPATREATGQNPHERSSPADLRIPWPTPTMRCSTRL